MCVQEGESLALPPLPPLPYQLCFSTGVSVVSLGGAFGAVEEATAPRAARVRVHANIPPTMPVDDAYAKVSCVCQPKINIWMTTDVCLGRPGEELSEPTSEQSLNLHIPSPGS